MEGWIFMGMEADVELLIGGMFGEKKNPMKSNWDTV